jgi:phosphohistidine phosphatase SixA
MLERTELESLAIVGHEPDLGRLLGVFLFCSPNAIAIKKAGACGIEFHDQPGPGQGVLKWFLGPRALQRLAQTRKGNA